MSDLTAGWKPDPTGRHDHRYFDGTQWTEHVSDAGVAATDPYDGPASTEPATGAPSADPPAGAASAASAERPAPSTFGGPPSATGDPDGPRADDPAARAGDPAPTDPGAAAAGAAGAGPTADPAAPDAGDVGTTSDPEPPAVSSWARPTVVNAPTEPITPPEGTGLTEPPAEAGTDLGITGADPPGLVPDLPAEDLARTDWPGSPDPTEEPAAAPPPPAVPPAAPGEGGGGSSKRGLLIGAGIVIVLAVLAAVFLLGDDDDGGKDLQTRIAEEIRAGGQSGLDEEEAECLASELIDRLGAERLRAVDFRADEPPAEIADDLNEAFVAAIPECNIRLGGGTGEDGGTGGDGVPTTNDTLSVDQLARFRDLLTEQYRDNLGLNEEKARCLANTMADAIEQGNLDEGQSFNAFFEYLDACGISVSELGAAGSGTG